MDLKALGEVIIQTIGELEDTRIQIADLIKEKEFLLQEQEKIMIERDSYKKKYEKIKKKLETIESD